MAGAIQQIGAKASKALTAGIGAAARREGDWLRLIPALTLLLFLGPIGAGMTTTVRMIS